jgi:hypothetical protein
MIKSKKSTKSAKSVTDKSKSFDEVSLEPHKQAPKSFFLITVIAIIVIVAVVVLTKTLVSKNKPAQYNDQNQVNQQQQQQQLPVYSENDLEKLVDRVGQLIEINRSEQPTIATVQDAELLRSSQPDFYKEAEVGDRLLVWSDKAVLYSTTRDKLLSVMLISNQNGAMEGQVTDLSGDTTTTQETLPDSTIESEKAVITVLNGTQTAGLAGKMRTKLTNSSLTVASIGDAQKKGYEKTLIVVLADKPMPATLDALRKITGAEVSQDKPDDANLKGDFVIIVGNDFVE